MGVFDFLSGNNSHLDNIIEKVQLNYSNNYVNDATNNLQELTEAFERLKFNGKLSAKQIEKYGSMITEYSDKIEKMKEKNSRPASW